MNMSDETSVMRGDDLLKSISLFFLTEALLRGYKEEVADIVRLARRFGARRSEIKTILRAKKRWASTTRRKAVNERSIP
ncbi:MAG TPA: hypothetical protein VL688_12910 [Verrucomicrobiae bacterium]|jgi:hypothetical protein|nr:hypothetical protein [Verrucomicrobiae bacterium]